jgi:hypothetical protein
MPVRRLCHCLAQHSPEPLELWSGNPAVTPDCTLKYYFAAESSMQMATIEICLEWLNEEPRRSWNLRWCLSM